MGDGMKDSRHGQILTVACVLMLAAACASDDPGNRALFADDADTSGSDLGMDGSDADVADEEDAMVLDMGIDTDVADQGTNNGLCQPNSDGVIERSEVPLRVGLNAKFRVATDVTFDTQGVMEEGVRTWDLSQSFSSDELTAVELASLEGKWFASEFPDADYVTRLSADQELLGVFEIAEDGLLLHGVVSPEDGFTATELSYDPPVATLEFPIDGVTSWQTDSKVSGTALGTPVFYDENYVYTPAGSGLLKTPFGEFEVLRIRADLERVQGLLTTRIRTYLFVAECFGTVATIRSQDNEDEVEFSDVAEVRRLAP